MNRTKEEIIKSILEALPDIKTRIRYKAEVWNNFQYYLCEVVSSGLVGMELETRRYFITERGKQYLAAVSELLVLSNC
jgi:predicted transcriptional regulator